jgi:hypothetical protein
MKAALDNIWASDHFQSGNQYFQLYNYNLFRIIEKTEFESLNPNTIQPCKQIFAVADATNGDREHSAYLYFDDNGEISIQSNYQHRAPVQLKTIAPNLEHLFGGKDFT